MTTQEQAKSALKKCRGIFQDKLEDYGSSWRIMRPMTVTDQLFTKAKRIRSLEETGVTLVGEGIYPEWLALVNYGIIGLIQLERGAADSADMDAPTALTLYDHYAEEALQLMTAKNHDYGEAWRGMRPTSYTDFVLTKLNRIKEIEDNGGKTSVSEGIASNYLDIINYALFALIKEDERQA